MSFLTSSGVSSKNDTKSFVRYSAPEKYCEYGVHQVRRCLSHPTRGRGRGGVGSVKEQSRVMHNISDNAKLKSFPALALYTSGLGFKVKTQNNNIK